MSRLPRQIILAGPMCVGKTSVAQILSEKVSKRIISIDEELPEFPQRKAWEVSGSSLDDWYKLREKFENGGFSGDPSKNYCMFKDEANKLYEPVMAAKFSYVANEYNDCILDSGSNLQIQSNDDIAKAILRNFNSQNFPVVLRYSDDVNESFQELYKRFLVSPRAEWLGGGLYSSHWEHFIRETIDAPLLAAIAAKGILINTKSKDPESIANEIISFMQLKFS